MDDCQKIREGGRGVSTFNLQLADINLAPKKYSCNFLIID